MNLAFLVLKNETVEGVASPVTKNVDYLYAQWTGDLTKGTYKIVPFPMTTVR